MRKDCITRMINPVKFLVKGLILAQSKFDKKKPKNTKNFYIIISIQLLCNFPSCKNQWKHL